jgi:ferredoxin-nitrite reductase
MTDVAFSEEQKAYLEGFAAGAGMKKALSLPVVEAQSGPESIHRKAQDRFVAAGKKLVAEEEAKRAKNGLDLWDEVVAHAKDARFPKGTDVFLFKFQGLFYVAPAQDSFMCRLRFPAGVVTSAQLRGLANLSLDFAGGYADVTTRANLQLREIGARNTVPLLMGLSELGIIPRGAGADNIRNVTASPTAGIDPQELIDTRPFAKELNHYILNNRELYGLPRKFNIAFDGGGTISALEETNDIGFQAIRIGVPAEGVEPGVYFRLALGGITGHKDFARDTGVVVRPSETTEVSAAVVKAFIEHGDRTDRKKARLKYVLDRMGFDGFLSEVEKHLRRKLTRVPANTCQSRPPIDRLAHLDVHRQKQFGLHYIGVVLPVGRLTASQLVGLSEIADRFGSGQIRLTVWQNLLIPDVHARHIESAKRAIEALDLDWRPSSIRAGLVACTGSAGCKYASADTKKHAMRIATYVESRLAIDQPVNIHLTGCHHSCAQHFIGDIGLIATKVAVGEEMVEGYHVLVGGGYGERQGLARELIRDVIADDTPHLVERILRSWLERRSNSGQSFCDFVRQTQVEQLRKFIEDYERNQHNQRATVAA